MQNTGEILQPDCEVGCTLFDLNYFDKHGISKSNPLLGIGAGDSSLYVDALSDDLISDLFDKLDNEISWNVMTHKGGPVPRLISIQGERQHGTCFPLYRHPADEQPSTIDFTSTALRCRDEVSELLGQPFNHALIQKYRNGKDNISEHADKTLDISRGTMIVNLSVGSTRVMILKSKPDHPGNSTYIDNEGKECIGKIIQKVTLPPNSIFVLGWNTNLLFTHSIKADKRQLNEKRYDEKLYNEQRISLTFRNIATYISPTGIIFGQGAKLKELPAGDLLFPSPDYIDHTKDIIYKDLKHEDEHEKKHENGKKLEKEHEKEDENIEESGNLLRAFGVENRSAQFDWEQHYGSGFNIVNFQIVNT